MKASQSSVLPNAIDAAIASISSLPDSAHWLVALSGGVDSTALLHCLHNAAHQTGQRMTALVVNHNLRPEAAAEAELVAARARACGIAAEVLTITTAPPQSGRQEWARHHRYKLLCAYARKTSGILWLAHHRDDQAETIAMRLSRASGLPGLAGMKMVSDHNHVICVRPFLSVPKEALICYCSDNNIATINDPSNSNHAFERVRWRTLLADDDRLTDRLFQLGVNATKISGVMRQRVANFWRSALTLHPTKMALICDRHAFDEAPLMMRFLLIRAIMPMIGASTYPPSAEAIARFCAAIAAGEKATLGGCQIFYEPDTLTILPEAGRPHAPLTIAADTDMIYQGRLLVRTNAALILQPMTKARFDSYEKENPYRLALLAKPPAIRMLFPFVHALDDSPITPHIKDMVQKGCFQHLDWPTEQVAIYPLSRIATNLM